MTSTSPLIFLPRDILSFVVNYFLIDESQNKTIFKFPYDWRNFINSNKEYFGQWKKESQLIALAGSDAERFYKSMEFREKIYTLIESPRLQLDLFFSTYDSSNPLKIDLNNLNSQVRRVDILGYPIIPCIMDVDQIFIFGRKIIPDLSFFSNVNILSVISSNRNEVPVDVGSLYNLEMLCLTDICNIKNCDSLAKLKSLKIHFCPTIRDVSCFKSIPDLTISHCPGITDVSSLGSVYKLNLTACANIRDVSALGRVHTLILNGCVNVTDLSALEWVHTLHFHHFHGTDLSGLKNIAILDILGSPNVSDVSMLHSLTQLNIEGCRQIETLNGLRKLTDVAMISRTLTSSNEIFPQLVKLKVDYENPVLPWIVEDQEEEHIPSTDNSLLFLSFTTNLRSLSIVGCKTLAEFPEIPNGLCSLEIASCAQFKTLPNLPSSLGYLSIASCGKLESLRISEGDGSFESTSKYPLYEVRIDHCVQLKQILFARTVFRSTIDCCYCLSEVRVVAQVAHLRIVRADSFRSITNFSRIVSLTGDYTKENAIVDEANDDILFFGY
jgi:hypothetical protein